MPDMKSVSTRRQFIKGAGVVGAAGALLPMKSATAAAKPQSINAKNLIFLVVDGMCNGTLGLAHHWNLRNKGEPLHWMQLYERPDLHRSFQETASASSPVTDSAAAASSWGCGQRVMNRSINTTVDGTELEPIFVRAKKAGKLAGLVSTCRISHATPAGFAANVAHRDDEHTIVGQYLDRGIDLLMGGGASKFLETRDDGSEVDYFAKFAKSGYTIARDKKKLKALSGSRLPLLGVFSDSHVPYALDRKNDASFADVPSLKEMFEAALKQLEDAPEGFVLQVEGGRVDHAGHANDPGAILHEYLEFDTCIPVALDFIEKHPDTLLIVTTDHGTGGCQLDGLGSGYNDSGPALDRINQYKQSFEWLAKRFRSNGSFNAGDFSMATGIVPTKKQEKIVQGMIKDPELKYLNSEMTKVFASELTAISATGWSSNNHTAENVELLAFGPGSTLLPGFIKNYELHGMMTKALGI
ncbi:MAG: alkaline phosphatase [Verrucomicrobiota bacterium]